jgi:hypothetical protein
MTRVGAAAVVAALTLSACASPKERSPEDRAAQADPIAPLHAFEEERRHATDFARLPASDRALGPDPVAIRALPDGRFVGLLRGRDAIVLLDASLREIARAPAPASPVGMALSEAGEIEVVGELSAKLASYRVEANAIVPSGEREVGSHSSPRAVAVHAEHDRAVAYVVDGESDLLHAVPLGRNAGTGTTTRVCAGPFRVARVGSRLVVDCLIDHALAVLDLDRRGLPVEEGRQSTLRHDGPIWGFDVIDDGRGLLIAAGGVEDHPLDRREGSFGFIDSFVYLYRLPPHGEPERLAAINVSEHGVITPKAISLRARPDGGLTVLAAGYGSDRLAEIAFAADLTAPPRITTRPSLPGCASFAVAGENVVCANPLFDAWVPLSAAPAPVPVPDSPPSPRSPDSLVGEALFFTNLMAPWNKTEGRLSRFTCETCHFEGYIDGRTHHTGRGDVRATTKPLLGLFNNRPHFTRALDPDMATMVHNEFRVAGANSGHDPWFSAKETGLAWIPRLAPSAADLDALGLRRALMTFLMDFSHRPNPRTIGRERFGASEQRGADLFAARCERCHEARLVADDPASRVPRDRWEALIFSREGPIVWASTGYHQTGVTPYVHEEGARATSLRRLLRKRPYFTNGSARSLRELLERASSRGDAFFHDGGPADATRLGVEEREVLLSFLVLL